LIEQQADQTGEKKSKVGRGANQSGKPYAVPTSPNFIDQCDTQRPLAAHAQRCDEPKRRELPSFVYETTQTSEKRIGKDRQGHRRCFRRRRSGTLERSDIRTA
jgi:hypothetical protein